MKILFLNPWKLLEVKAHSYIFFLGFNFVLLFSHLGASLIAQLVKNLPAMQETPVQFLGQEDLLKKGLATHSSILGLPWWLSWLRIWLQCRRPGFNPWVGNIPWRRERLPTPVFWPGEFHGQSNGLQRVGHDWVTFIFTFSCSVRSDSLQPHGLQHTRLPCPSVSPGVCSKSCPLPWWCHPTISSCSPPSLPALNLSQHQGLFPWVSSSHQVAKVLDLQFQHQSFQWVFRVDFRGLSRVFSSTTVWKHQFFRVHPSLWSNSHTLTWLLEKP